MLLTSLLSLLFLLPAATTGLPSPAPDDGVEGLLASVLGGPSEVSTGQDEAYYGWGIKRDLAEKVAKV